ncbi:hypothetical protein ACIRP0_34440 [Streptomyces sp. NPDC101733]|uniref:hypothetical protein n=1 Tax=unclassified Streptomyces TaxID=2593676 RepID=UPI003808EDDF
MTLIEPGLSVRGGFAEGPLADVALSRAARAGQLLDEVQEQAPTLTDGQLLDGVHRALRRFTQEQPPTSQVDSITALIRRGVRIDWAVSDRLPSA